MGRGVTVGLGAPAAPANIAAALAAASASAPSPGASGDSSTFTPDYYISPSGSDSSNGLTSSTPWKTFNKAFTTMAGGTSLGLMDGTYSVAAGTGYISDVGTNSNQPPSGNSLSDQTVVRAINPGSVKVVGALTIGTKTRKDSYITIRGITFEGGSGGELYNTSYVTVKECGFHGPFGIGTNDHDNGNTRNLIEDVWIWSTDQRVIAINYRAHENVWRRVVVRGDGCGTGDCEGSGNPNFGISVYDCHDVSLQNVIVIDRILLAQDEPYADFGTAQHTSGSLYLMGRDEWLGCMSIGAPDSGVYFEADETIQGGDPTWTMTNFVAWGSADVGVNLGGGGYNGGQKVVLSNVTVGHAGGIGVRLSSDDITAGSVTNVLVSNVGDSGLDSPFAPTYCNVYNAAGGAYGDVECTVGAYTYNAETDGSLEYIPRIESGSNLKGAGASGADIGANIVNRYGTDGTRFGDSGYNTLTSTALWPWPNESRIRQEMGPDSGISRGFCATGQTLTKYIWEFLGNANPY